MRHRIYPTCAQLNTLVTLLNHGYSALCSDARDSYNRDTVRNLHVVNIKGLITRLDLDYDYWKLFTDNSRFRKRDISPSVVEEMRDVSRYHGYVYADTRQGGYRVTPLTGSELLCVTRAAFGDTTKVAAARVGMDIRSIGRNLSSARKRHDCETTAQLVGMAYRLGWFPDQDEMFRITNHRSRRSDAAMPAGHLTQDRK
jgi:hypothetical protein